MNLGKIGVFFSCSYNYLVKMTNRVFIKFILISAAYVGFVLGDCDKPKQLSVIISYETELEPVTCFFNNQLTYQLFESLNKCGVIRWNFMPCSTSSMANGVLVCRGGDCQCAADKIHACAAALYKDDQVQVGKFVMCYFMHKDAKKCATDNGMCYDTIENCVNKKDGDKYCNAFFDRIINDWQTVYTPGIKFGSKYDDDLNYNAVLDFKTVLCAQLKNNGLQCDVCSCNSG